MRHRLSSNSSADRSGKGSRGTFPNAGAAKGATPDDARLASPLVDDSTARLFIGQHPWQRENADRNGAALSALADRLLALGGRVVVVPPDNPELVEVEIALLLGEGRAYNRADAVSNRAAPPSVMPTPSLFGVRVKAPSAPATPSPTIAGGLTHGS